MRILTMLLLLGAGLSFADTVTLRDGRSIQGSFLGGDARTVRIAVGDRVETYAIGDVANLSFEAPPPPVAAQPPEPPPRVFRPESREDRREERREARAEQLIPAGTVLTIRMVDSVDSERDRLGQTFRASLDEPVIDNAGNTQVQRGADVVVKLVDDQQSGKIAGRTILTLDVVSLYINGRTVETVSYTHLTLPTI